MAQLNLNFSASWEKLLSQVREVVYTLKKKKKMVLYFP